jgi:anti-anti-sigma factor
MRTESLSIEIRGTAHETLVRCRGPICARNVEVLRRALATAVHLPAADVCVCLEGARLVDCSGVTLLMRAQTQLSRRGGHLRVLAGPEAARMLHRLGVDSLMDVREAPRQQALLR